MVHGKPVSGDFAIQILVTDCGLFQSRPQRFRAPVGHEVLHRQIDESAALAGLGHAVNGLDRGLRQDDVDSFAHGNEI